MIYILIDLSENQKRNIMWTKKTKLVLVNDINIHQTYLQK